LAPRPAGGLSEDPRGVRKPLWKELFAKRDAQEIGEGPERPLGLSEARTLETTAAEPTEGQPENEKPERGIWLPHPDNEKDRRNLGKGEGV